MFFRTELFVTQSALHCTALNSFSVLFGALPQQRETCPEGIYLTAVMAITSISVVVTVVVLNFHYRGPSRKEVPPRLRRLILERLASCTCFQTINDVNRRKPANHYESNISRETAGNVCFKTDSLRLTIDSLHEEISDTQDLPSNESVTSMGDFAVKKRCGKNQGSSASGGGAPSVVAGNGRVQDEILRTLRYLLLRQEQEDHHIRVVNEWRQMALVIDRFLFWIFFVITVVSSLSFLVIVPLQRRGLKFV